MLAFDELPTELQDVLADWPARRATPTKETTMTTNANTPNSIDWRHLYEELSRPFSDSIIKYRVGAVSRDRKKAQALAFVPVRSYEDRLNELVPGSWSVTFEPWGADRIICRLTIHGVTRSSTGDGAGSPDQIAGTAAEAQALKRACAKFGLGRHLYDLPVLWTDYDPERRTLRPPSEKSPNRNPNAGQIRHEQPTIRQGPTDPGHLGRDRAANFHLELIRIGVPRSRHVTFASEVLGRPVKGLYELSEGEARQILKEAPNATGVHQWASRRSSGDAP